MLKGKEIKKFKDRLEIHIMSDEDREMHFKKEAEIKEKNYQKFLNIGLFLILISAVLIFLGMWINTGGYDFSWILIIGIIFLKSTTFVLFLRILKEYNFI